MLSQRTFWFAVVALLVTFPVSKGSAEETSPGNANSSTAAPAISKLPAAAQAYIDAQEKYRHVSAKIETQLAIIDKGKTTSVRELRSTVKRDGERFVATTDHVLQKRNGKRDGRRFQTHSYVGGGLCHWYRTPNARSKPKPVEGNVDIESGDTYCSIDLGTALDGYFDGSNGKSLAEILQLPSSKVEVKGRTTINGEPCREISAKTTYGNIRIWASEKYDSIPLRVTYEKTDLDRWQGVNTVKASKYSSKLPHMAAWSATLSGVVISKMGDRYVPSGGKLRVAYKLQDEHEIEYEAFYVRPKFKAGVKFSKDDKSFAFSMPDGALMHNKMVQDDGTTYIWRKGQMVEGTPTFGPQAPKRKRTWLTSVQNFSVWVLDLGLISMNAFAALALVRVTPWRRTRIANWLANLRWRKK